MEPDEMEWRSGAVVSCGHDAEERCISGGFYRSRERRVQSDCGGDRAKDGAVSGGEDSDILPFDAKKPRFGGAFGLRSVPPSCKGERGDFERVLRSRSIDGGDECVRDGDRCGKHSSGDAYESTTHIVGLCAGERAGGTRWGKERGDHDAAGERRGRRGENGGGTIGRSDDLGGGVPTTGVGSTFRWAYESGWMRGGRGGMWGLCRVRVWVAKGRGSREECGVEDGSRDVHRAEISTNGNTTTISRTNPKRGEGGGEVTTAFERASGAMSILSMGWDGGRRASVETVSSGRVRTKSRITRTDSRDDASSARDGGVWRLRSMFCATSMMRAMGGEERGGCETRGISSDGRRSMPIYGRDNGRVRDGDGERYGVRAASVATIK